MDTDLLDSNRQNTGVQYTSSSSVEASEREMCRKRNEENLSTVSDQYCQGTRSPDLRKRTLLTRRSPGVPIRSVQMFILGSNPKGACRGGAMVRCGRARRKGVGGPEGSGR